MNVRQHNVSVDEQIMAEFDENPTKSIRQVAAELGIGIWKVWSVLRQDGGHAFHYTPVQGKILLVQIFSFFIWETNSHSIYLKLIN